MKTLFILCLLTAASLAHAGPEAWLQSGLISPEHITALKDELGLSSEQEERMQAIVTAAQSEGESLEKIVRERQKAFNDLLRNRQTSANDASAALTSLLEAEAPVKQLQLRSLIQLRDVLSHEQQKKAIQLAPNRVAKTDGIETKVKQKAEKLRAMVDSLGIKPTTAISERGSEIEGMIKAGDWKAADAALDKLAKDSRADELEATEDVDFSKYEPGNTDVEDLRQRYELVKERGQSVVSLPLIRQFVKAKEAFEEAKANQDAEKVGRILTWVEKELAKL
ncbi:MAG: periplasmic heavy metal sensor [Verrucomicrobiota bacterium]